MAWRFLLQTCFAANLALLCFAEDVVDFGFGSDVAEHFVMPPAPDHVHEIAAEAGKPVMVMLMNKVSPVCNTLKKAIKNGSKVKALLDSFTVAYAEESIDKWTEDKYVPQVVFYHGGERMNVESGHKSGKYLYADEGKLEAAMVKALSLSKDKKKAGSSHRGPSCMGNKECTGIDDKDMCEFTDGCTWGTPKKEGSSTAAGKLGCSGSAECDDIDEQDMCEFTDGCSWNSGGEDGPCQGGEQCKGIDDQEMCDFTDGCEWTGENQMPDPNAEPNPEHRFGKELADKIMQDPSGSAMSQAAKKQQKPYMVLITQDWCGPCKELLKGINAGTAVKGLLDNFVVGHATGDHIHEWQPEGQNYVPQAHWYMADGKKVEVHGPNTDFKYYFSSEYELVTGMKEALGKMKNDSEL